MKRMGIAVLVGAALCLGGCGLFQQESRQVHLGESAELVETSLNNIGGQKGWRSVDRVCASAIVSVYVDGANAYTNRQDQLIDVNDGWINSLSITPGGELEVVAEIDGDYRYKNGLSTDEKNQRVAASLVTLIRALRGPLNLTDRDVVVTNRQRVRVAGEDLIRLDVADDPAGVQSYYFQEATALLRYMDLGATDPYSGMAELSWEMQPNGLAFPSRVRVCNRGEFTLIGGTPLLDVEIRTLRFEPEDCHGLQPALKLSWYDSGHQ